MTREFVCPKCGGLMDEGRLQGFTWYVSDHAKAAFWSTGPEVRVSRARACRSCGYVELYLDPQALSSNTDSV